MGDDLGTEFSDAAALWAEWQRSAEGEQDHRSQDSTAAAALG